MISTVVVTISLLAQVAAPPPKPSPDPSIRQVPQSGDVVAKLDQAEPVELKAIVSGLAAIRDEIAKGNQDRHEYYVRPDGPIWSNWALVIIAAVAGWVAWVAFSH